MSKTSKRTKLRGVQPAPVVINTDWWTVTAYKVVYRPIIDRDAEPDDEPRSFQRIGVRVDMLDGTYWYHHFASGTWTHHWFKTKREMWSGTKCGLYTHKPERVEYTKAYTNTQLVRAHQGKLQLVVMLNDAFIKAVQEDEAKRRS